MYKGIHDAGWQEFGYWFSTPEGWEASGNYRSMGYMRALCIWAIEFARQQQCQMNRIDRQIDLKDGVDEEVHTFDIVVVVDEVGAMDDMEPQIYIYTVTQV